MANQLTSLLIALGLLVLPLTAADAEATKTRVRDLHARTAEVRINLVDGTNLSGRILRVDPETFTLALEKTGQERTLSYTQLTDIQKKGLSRRAKAILIPAAIGGAVLLVLCVAPYPIGYLCRADPS